MAIRPRLRPSYTPSSPARADPFTELGRSGPVHGIAHGEVVTASDQTEKDARWAYYERGTGDIYIGQSYEEYGESAVQHHEFRHRSLERVGQYFEEGDPSIDAMIEVFGSDLVYLASQMALVTTGRKALGSGEFFHFGRRHLDAKDVHEVTAEMWDRPSISDTREFPQYDQIGFSSSGRSVSSSVPYVKMVFEWAAGNVK